MLTLGYRRYKRQCINERSGGRRRSLAPRRQSGRSARRAALGHRPVWKRVGLRTTRMTLSHSLVWRRTGLTTTLT
jgi:hypothetical protein